MSPLLYRSARLLLVLAIVQASCTRTQRENRSPVPLHPVRGTVLVAGAPAAHAVVVFHPVQPLPRGCYAPTATVREDGSFQLSSFSLDDGAPEGEYLALVVWPADHTPGYDEGADRLEGRYNDPATSTLRVRVNAGDNVLKPFELE